jgi:methyl-accepting chemotaxis protein
MRNTPIQNSILVPPRTKRLMRNATIGRKLGVMAGAIIVPCVFLLGFCLYTLWADLKFTLDEQDGVAYLQPLAQLNAALDDRQVAVTKQLLDKGTGAAAETARIDELVRAMDEADTRYGNAETSAMWAELRTAWSELKSSQPSTVPEAMLAHRTFSDQVTGLKNRIATDWKIVLDPETAAYYALDVAVMRVPDLQRLVALSRGRLLDARQHGSTDDAGLVEVVELTAVARDRLATIKDELSQAKNAAQDRAGLIASLDAIEMHADEIGSWLKQVQQLMLARPFNTTEAERLVVEGEALPARLATLQDGVTAAAGIALELRADSGRVLMTAVAVLTAASLLAAVWLTLSLSGRIGGAVRRLEVISNNITEGKYDNIIDDSGEDEISKLFASIRKMQVQLGEDLERRAASEAIINRLRGGLDSTSAAVLVADETLKAVYLNHAMTRLFTDCQADLRQVLPDFDPRALVGFPIDRFYREHPQDAAKLGSLAATQVTWMTMGRRQLRVTASPILTAGGQRLGTVVEWADKTTEINAEREVASIVEGVVAGNFDNRIPLEGKSGFQEALSKGINELVGNIAEVVMEVRKLVAAANGGDLKARMQLDGRAGIFRSIGQGINDLVADVAGVVDEVQAMVAAANSGDLTRRMQLDGRAGLFRKVGGGVNDLTDNMASIVSSVKAAAGEVSRGAEEISRGNQSLSQRTEEQASSLEQTASSMEEMTSVVRQNSDNAGQANQLALAARDQAEKGGAVVSKAITAMSGISEASKRIVDIIGVIDDIAFQTNLLALNAAVEAARAGEQGRGFAVVASEVRSLAGRSASAAKEIKSLIQASVERVEQGSNLVSQSGDTLQEIVSAVKKLTDLVAEIAAASHEQSTGIEQVNKAVVQLDELTQQNAALVEEASAASEAMAEQARALAKQMARYVVDERAGRGAGAAARGTRASQAAA